MINERFRDYLIQRAGLVDDDLADSVVIAELERLSDISAEHHQDWPNGTAAEFRFTIGGESLRVTRDHQRQIRRLRPVDTAFSADELAALEALYSATTPGVYLTCHDGECVCGLVSSDTVDAFVHAPARDDGDGSQMLDTAHIQADARFFAQAHNLMPRILVALRKDVQP